MSRLVTSQQLLPSGTWWWCTAGLLFMQQQQQQRRRRWHSQVCSTLPEVQGVYTTGLYKTGAYVDLGGPGPLARRTLADPGRSAK
jgi:hypothetical protein